MTTTTPNTTKSLLDSLANVGGYVGLAVQLGETLIPLGVGLVNKIRGISNVESTETYMLLVAGDQTELLQIISASQADLAAVNAELVRLGAQPLPVPATPAAPITPAPAPSGSSPAAGN
jgi:hypothetical protein